MKVEVLMPKMGESITEGRILKWVKKAGDTISRDDTIAEISTDKVDTEVPSPESGVIVQLLANENDTVEVNKPIAIIESDVNAAQRITTPSEIKSVESRNKQEIESNTHVQSIEQPAVAAKSAIQQVDVKGTEGKFYSPVVMRIASGEGISMTELENVQGTGINGRVTKNDLLVYIEQKKKGNVDSQKKISESARTFEIIQTESTDITRQPSTSVSSTLATAGVEIIPMDNLHRIMAEHMVRSVHTSPHVTEVSEVDMTAIANFRQQNAEAFKSREGFSLTFMPFIADAAIRALKDFPYVNASIEGTDIIVKKFINLGIAVALDSGGLIVPVVKNADALNLIGLARAVNDVAARARKKRLLPDEIQEGTFTITNYGVFGNLLGTPIINQPQVAILGVGAVKKRPVVIERDGEEMIAVRSMMYVSLSFDHRLVDGALGGMYLERVVNYLESFSLSAL